MKKICAASGKEFEITTEDLAFYEKMGVPAPTLCPEERQRRRLSWRNERTLYQRKCDATEETTISMYSPDKKFPVYLPDYWWSDKWDVKSYGRDFDFSRPFFEQLRELQSVVPRPALSVVSSENCHFVNQCGASKNCYLSFNTDYSEGCFYCTTVLKSKDCMDCLNLEKSELCYGCVDCFNCYNSKFLQDCTNCVDSLFLRDCVGCSNCFGCMNLRNKEFYFLNKRYTKEEFFKKLKDIKTGKNADLINLQNGCGDFYKKFPHKFAQITNSENCTGDYLKNCQNAHNSFDSFKNQDIKFCSICSEAKDFYDFDVGGYRCELCYEMASSGDQNYNCRFALNHWGNCSNTLYCDISMGLKDSFGCIGVMNSQYCILNKQYTKEEYFSLREKIITHMKDAGEWGEFFPVELSPFAYNETVAQEYFPMTKEEVLDRGWKWRDEEKKKDQGACSLASIPNNITDVPESICNEILACECCAKNYKIQKTELKFYRKMELPIPHKCPDCRHADRMKLRNPRHLFSRKCDKCGIDIQTTFAPERPEKVYCEACYLDSLQ